LRAVESGNVVVVSDELARPSPGMVDAIEQLARELHPEAFSPQSTNGNFDLGYRGQFARRASLEEGCVLCAR
jgi:hypothetical protein